MQLCGAQSYLEDLEKNPYALAPYTIAELLIQIRTSGMAFSGLKPLTPIQHIHEGMTKWFKYCRPEFYGVLFKT